MKELNVLLIDDEILALEYLQDIISWSDHGYEIIGTATSTARGYDLFRKNHPHIVISISACLAPTVLPL